jgi:hypothetical protein
LKPLSLHFGIRTNLAQVLQHLLQVLLVGMTIGMMRTVVPALAETEFGVPRGSFMLLVAFVVAFGFVKGAMNFVAGRLAESGLDANVYCSSVGSWHSPFRCSSTSLRRGVG